jgi:hypothetical protein
MFEIIGLAAAGAAGLFGYVKSRGFVRKRLRFVDAVKKPYVPVLAGGAAALVAAPVVAILPIVGAGTAIVFGASVGVGVASARKDIESGKP